MISDSLILYLVYHIIQAKERDSVKVMLDQQTNSAPLQVAELQSELARVRNQLASMNSKQALIEQYERRLKDSSDQAEKLSAQLNSLALNLQSKETMVIISCSLFPIMLYTKIF